ncbi:MAG TPA: lamin tail domain-containing protein [Chloroflexia bacterium]|nr:lamin tail domain-containing protein [Chloroflexia bacterium]
MSFFPRSVSRITHHASRLWLPTLALIVLGLVGLWAQSAQSQSQAQFAHPAFKATWDRTDGLVAATTAKRPWVWGPVPGRTLSEPFAELPGNAHLVQYFDKGRMEINNPGANPNDPFYVTNGLLAVELIGGVVQTGANTFEKRSPAPINLASDVDDLSAPTYQSFNGVSSIPGAPNDRRKTSQVGQIVRTAIDRQGTTQPWPGNHPDYGVRISQFWPDTGHNIPDVFWDYLNQQADIIQDGQAVKGPLFYPWFAVTGYPISEPYWSYVKVAGTYTDVLIQAYQRRVLTYVPHLPSPFKVQMGNIGQHYYDWRYLNAGQPGPGGNTPTSQALPPKASIAIEGISYRASLTDINGTYTTLKNGGQSAQSFNSWWLDSPKWGYVDRFYFPNGITLAPGASVRVHSGPGINTSTDIYMYRTTVMWDRQLYDLAVLYDNYGREVDRFFPASDVGAPPTAVPPGAATATPAKEGTPVATPTRASGTPAATATRPGVPSPVSTASTPRPTTGTTATATAISASATPTAAGGCPPVDDSMKSTISATGDIEIFYVETEDPEFVDIFNIGDDDINIGNWVLRDKNNTSLRFVFPAGTILDSGGDAYVCSTQLVTGCDFTFNQSAEIWNECGAALELLNGSGQVVATYAYGTHCIGDDCP